MKQFLLATVLIAVPVAAFSSYEILFAPAAPVTQTQAQTKSQGLGDLSSYKVITTDVQKIAATGDFTAAEKRATDFEKEWDDNATRLRSIDPVAWGNVDAAADAVFKSLRQGTPSADNVSAALADLQTSLGSSGIGAGAAGTQSFIKGIAVTDVNGHPIPCEDLIGQLKTASAKAGISSDSKAKAADFLTKALERCNADDDQRADAFSAQGLAVLNQ